MKNLKIGNIFIMFLFIWSIAFELLFAFITHELDLKFYVIQLIVITQIGIVFFPAIMFTYLSKKTNTFVPLNSSSLYLKDFLIVIGIGVLSSFITSFINLVAMQFVSTPITDTINKVTNYPVWMGLFFLALLPAVFEEFLFRGVLYSILSKYNIKIAILVSALAFGMYHMNINQFAYAFALGLLLALVYIFFDSLIAPIFLHFSINAMSVILSNLLNQLEEITTPEITDTIEETISKENSFPLSTFIFYGIAATIATVSIYKILRYIAAKKGKEMLFKEIFSFVQEKQSSIKATPADSTSTISTIEEGAINNNPTKKASFVYYIPLIIASIIFLFFAIITEIKA